MLALCSCTASLLAPTVVDESFAKQKWEDATLQQLNEGYHLYVNKCAGCHHLHNPKDYTEEKWRKEMPEMGKRAYLSLADQDKILRYVLSKKETLAHR